MAEPIFKRMQRVVSSGLESATDAAERLNSGGMMRQAVREIGKALDMQRQQHGDAEARAEQAKARQAAIREQLKALGGDARYAMDKGRDDLARAVLTRQVELEEEAVAEAAAQREATALAGRLVDAIEETRARKTQMERDLAAAEVSQRGAAPSRASSAAARKADRAEETFERVLRATGGAPNGAETEAAAGVDELRAVRREDEITARLAALKAGAEAPAKEKRRRGAK